MNKFLIIMGVSGCGKTTIGKRIAASLDIPFYEGDDYHSRANVSKMAGGAPLTDADRQGWLAALAELIAGELNKGCSGVLACSALKEKYRRQLTVDPEKVKFIYLKGSYDLIFFRMKVRKSHYMAPDMLKSQFQVLEEPDDVFTINIERSPDEIVDEILTYLEAERSI